MQNRKVSAQDCNTSGKARSAQNGRRKNSKSARRSNKQAVSTDNLQGEVHNDPNWYFTSTEIADQASTFSFNEFLGVKSFQSGRFYDSTDHIFKYYAFQLTNPTILVGYVNPSPGTSQYGIQEMSGVNAVALKTYTMLSSRNGKTTSYAPQDITMLILAMGEIISMMEYMRRAFGVAYTYNQRNRTLPKRLIESMGIDYDDMSANMADYRMRFNALITTINKIPFPVNIAYISKCAAIYQNIYLDSESSMASIVYLRPYTTWLLDEIGSEKGSQLLTQSLPFSRTPQSMAIWFDTISTMINAVLTSATFNTIFSDILMLRDKYSMPLMVLDYLASDYAVVPTYNPMFMLQIHNSTVTGNPLTTSPGTGFTKDNDVTSDPDNNMILYNPSFVNNQYVPDGAFIDFPVSNPDVAMRIEATRFTSVPNPSVFQLSGSDDYTPIMLYYLPDHYVISYDLFNVDATIENRATLNRQWVPLDQIDADKIAFTGVNMGPTIMAFGTNIGGKANNNKIVPLSTVDYFTFLPKEWFYRVNDLTYMALFEVR